MIAYPRSAGDKSAVKPLNCCNSSPKSIPGTLLMIFRRATLAQALSVVFLDVSD